MARDTMRRIREAVRARRIPREFTPREVNKALGIDWGGTFLPNRVGNPGHNTELFVRVGGGVHRLKEE